MEWQDQEWCLLQSRQLGNVGHHPWVWGYQRSRSSAPEQTSEAEEVDLCKRIPGRELCSDYTTSWNDQEKTKELPKRSRCSLMN